MFVVLEKDRHGWLSCKDSTEYGTEDEAIDFIDENGLVDAAVFEFKRFV